jgi:tetratricopeptide (TPR) repeat protein
MASLGLTLLREKISVQQRLMKGKAFKWASTTPPPLTVENLNTYSASLDGGLPGDKRAVIARALLWGDLSLRVYRIERIADYQCAADANPDDEMCAFFVASLCDKAIIKDDETATRYFSRVIRPKWEKSIYWSKLGLSRRALIESLSEVFQSEDVIPSADQAEVLESALSLTSPRSPQFLPLLRCLATAYRSANRDDDDAIAVYSQAFIKIPKDHDNITCLGNIFKARRQFDIMAYTIYAHLARFAEDAKDIEAMKDWLLYQSYACMALERWNEVSLTLYLRVNALVSDNSEVQLYLAYTAAHCPKVTDAPQLIRIMSVLLEDEEKNAQIFHERNWDWNFLLNAVAQRWFEAKREDEKAIALYYRIVKLYPDEMELAKFLANILASRRIDTDESISIYEKAYKLDPKNAEVRSALAYLYVKNATHKISNNKKADALKVWEETYQHGEKWPELVHAMLEAYENLDRVSETTLGIWEKITADQPDDSSIRLRLARAYGDRGQLIPAQRWYDEALAIAPDNYEVLSEYGMMLQRLGTGPLQAVAILRRASVTFEGAKNRDLLYALGEGLLQLNEREEAKGLFEQVLTLCPDDAPAMLHLARLNLKYEITGLDRAESLYKKAREINPNNTEVYRQLAEVYQAVGDTNAQEQALLQYLSRSDAEKYYQLAQLYMQRGEYREAEKALRQVITIGRADKKFYTLLGEVIHLAQKQAA